MNEVTPVPEVLLVYEVTQDLTVASVFQVLAVHEVLLAEKVPTAELVSKVHEVWKVPLVLLELTVNPVSLVTPVLTANALSVTVSYLLDTLKLLLTHLVQSAPRRSGMVSHSCTCLVTTTPTSKI